MAVSVNVSEGDLVGSHVLHSSRVFLLLLLYGVFMALSVRLRSEFSTRTFYV